MLTKKQRRLLQMIDDRNRMELPTVQRDLAEQMGICRESLNRLLARTRRALAAEGRSLPAPATRHRTTVEILPLPEGI